MTPEQKEEFDDFVRERNEMLMACDVDRAIAFHEKYDPVARTPSRDIVEVGIHKARTACLSLPIEARQESHQWLKERGYSSFGDDLETAP